MEARTTRERITDRLREEAATPADLSADFDIARSSAVSHVDHIAKSIEGTGEELLVRPPACEDCGFDAFDDPINRPSRCPECKSEAIAEPAFKISDVE